MMFDRPALDCAGLKKLVGGNGGHEEMEWQAVHAEWLWEQPQEGPS